MEKGRAIGWTLLLLSIVISATYGYLLFFTELALLLLKLTAFIAVLVALSVVGWIGYMMATMPSTSAGKSEEELEKKLREIMREDRGG